jgi:hypothetical protein
MDFGAAYVVQRALEGSAQRVCKRFFCYGFVLTKNWRNDDF